MKIKRCIMLGYLSMILCSCSIPTEKNQIYDNDHLIVRDADSYSYKNKVGDMKNMVIEDFSGTETIYIFENERMLDVKTSFHVSDGRFKVLLISPQNEIIELVGDQSILMKEKNYRIKIVGDHADVQFSIYFRS